MLPMEWFVIPVLAYPCVVCMSGSLDTPMDCHSAKPAFKSHYYHHVTGGTYNSNYPKLFSSSRKVLAHLCL